MNALNLDCFFSVPVWSSDLQDVTDKDERDAIAFCKKLKNETPGRVLSNVGGWQSNDLYPSDITNTPLEIYFKSIQPLLKQSILHLGIEKEHYVDNIWININGKTHYNSFHVHPRSLISGVFYLTKNNSNLVFGRPSGIDTYSLEMNYSKNNTFLSYTSISYSPTNKQVFLFPSWLLHCVEKNDSEEERISVAFNVSIIR